MANVIELIIRATDEATKPLENFTDKLSSSFEDVGKSMLNAGVALGAGIAPAVAAFGDAINQAAGFESQMDNIQAILGATDAEAENLTQTLLTFSASTTAGADNVAAAFEEIVGGVADASTHMAILEQSVKTAEAGQADLMGTTSAMVSIMNSYAFSAEEAAMVSDVLTQTVGAGVGSMEAFAAAFPQVTGLAASLGIELEDVGSAMAFMTTKGFSASTSANQLRQMMVALLNPNEKMKESLEEIGFASGDLAIEQLGLVGAYQALNSESGTFQSNVAGAVGSVEALNGVVALTDDTFNEFHENFVDGMEGATDAAREVQLGNFTAQMQIANSAVEALRIQIGLALLPTITRLVRAVQPVIGEMIAWAQANPDLIRTVAMITAAVAALATGLTVVGAVMTVLGGALAVVLSPLALFAAGVALAGLAIKENFLGIGDALDAVPAAINNAISAIKAAFDQGGIIGVAELVKNTIEDQFNSASEQLNNFVDEWRDNINTLIDVGRKFGTESPQFFGFLVKFFGQDAAPLIQTAVIQIESTLERLLGSWIETFSTLEQVARKFGLESPQFFGFLVKFFNEDLANIIQGAATGNVTQALNGLVDGMRNTLVAGVDRTKTAAEPLAEAILSGLRSGLGSVASWVDTNVITPAIAWLSNEQNVQDVSRAAGDLMRQAIEGMVEGIGNIGEWVRTNLIDPLIASIKGEGTEEGGVGGSGKSLGEAILDGIKLAFFDIPSWIAENIFAPFILGLTGEENMAGVLEAARQLANDILAHMFDFINVEVPTFVHDNLVKPIAREIEHSAQSVIDAAVGLGEDIVNGIIDGWNNNLDALKTTIVDTLSNALPGWAKNALQIFSPSKVFADIGKEIPAGLALGMEETAPVQAAAANMTGAAVSDTESAALRGGSAMGLGGPGGGIVINGDVVIQTDNNPEQAWDKLEQEARRRNRIFAPKAGMVTS